MTGTSHRPFLACRSLFDLRICSEFNCFPLRDLSEVGPSRERDSSSLGKLLNLVAGWVWEGAWCGGCRSSSADVWFQRMFQLLSPSLAVGRMEGESRLQMVQRTAQGSKGTEQNWLQLWVTELKVQPSIEEHNGFVEGKELGLNHYLCFFSS